MVNSDRHRFRVGLRQLVLNRSILENSIFHTAKELPVKGDQLKATIQALFGDDVIKARSSNEEITIICPIAGCGDTSGNRSINLRTGKTNCWRCNKGYGSFVKFCRSLGYDIDDTTSLPMTLTEAESLLAKVEENKTLTPVISNVKLPKGFTLLKGQEKSIYYELIAEMAIRKNLHVSDFEQAGVGFTREGGHWESFAIFPVTEWHRTVYYQGRLYGDPPEGDKRTKKFPSKNECPLGAKYWVYNIDSVRDQQADTVVVVESILNVMSLKKKLKELGVPNIVPVCVFKHSVSASQLAKIQACKSVKEICLFYDADADTSAWSQAAKMVNRMKVTIATMPKIPGKPTLDPNDDVDTAIEAFLDRKDYSPAEEAFKLVDSL